jgi:hypothetical protein
MDATVQEKQNRTPVLQRCAAKIGPRLIRYKVPFWTGMLAGLFAYTFAFTNKLLNSDEASYLFGKGATWDSGRWGLDILSVVLPNVSLPWFNGILTLLLAIASGCLLLTIFDIQNKWLQGLLTALIVTFPSLTCTFIYMFTSAAYGVALLLAIAAVYFVKAGAKVDFRAHWGRYLLGLIFLVLSLSIYQAYISFAASCLLLIVLQKLLTEKKNLAALIREAVFYVLFLAAALGIYYGITRLILLALHQTFNAYATQYLKDTGGIAAVCIRILKAYHSLWKMLVSRRYGLVPTKLSAAAHFVCVAIVTVKAVVWSRGKGKAQVAALWLLLGLFPLGVNFIYLFVHPGAVHTLVVYPVCIAYVLVAVMIEAVPPVHAAKAAQTEKGKAIKWRVTAGDLAAAAMAVILLVNIWLANKVYLKLYLNYENAYAFYTSVVTEVKMTPGFDSGSKIALVGNASQALYPYWEFDDLQDLIGAQFSVNANNRESFIRYYIGFNVPFADSGEVEALRQTQEFAQMSVYPYYGSVQKIGEYIVVRLE